MIILINVIFRFSNKTIIIKNEGSSTTQVLEKFKVSDYGENVIYRVLL